jgi:putative Holliday junction resolvase
MQPILGIDLGEARIGVALSDDLGMMAHPHSTIAVREVSNPAARVAEICRETKVSKIVLGLPRNMNGTYGPAADKARAFAAQLEQAAGLPVILWDERLTTVEAQRALHASGRNVKQSRQVIDQVAAQFILQSYLDAQAPPLE